MAWNIELSRLARKHLKNLPPHISRRILKFLHERIAPLDNPRLIGEALTGAMLGDYWKYRVGDYRIIARIEDGLLNVFVVRVGHRRDVYKYNP